MLVSKTVTLEMTDLVEIEKLVEKNKVTSISDFIRKAVKKEIECI